MRRRRFDKRILVLCLGIFVATFSFSFLFNGEKNNNVEAADLSKFNPGNIMSDYVMSDYNSMTEAEIQSFLTSKNTCENRDYSYYEYLSGRNPGIKWHWKDGHFVCLSEELFGDGMVIGEGKTAAKIIYETAQEFKINPKVLIVLIQKESGLITDPIPNDFDYRAMTGFGCPDTAPCDSKYYGFKNQIRKAAELFREVLDGGWTNYPLGENYVQYNPNRDCGGSIVNIENLATSALYRYTPYQPNAGALAAGQGTAPCGAYGNRNFYAYYSDWFGDSYINGNEIELAEGYYSVVSKRDNNMRLDVSGASVSDGANINLWSSNESGAQEWLIKKAEEGFYYLINPNSGKYLSTLYGSYAKGANIHQWGYTGECVQRWKPVMTDDKFVTFVSKCTSSKAIDISGGDNRNGTNVQVWDVNNQDAQKWKLIPKRTIIDGTYRITLSNNNKKSIDVSGVSDKDGGNVNIWDNNESGAQEWTIIRDANSDYYYIINPHSQKYLDTSNSSVRDGSNVYQWSQSQSCTQKWSILRTIDEYYTIVSSCEVNKVIDIDGNGVGNGENIRVWKADNSKTQKWNIANMSNILGEGTYRIVSALIEKSVDILGVGDKNGTNIWLWDNNESGAQEWEIIKNNDDDESYSFRNPNSGKYLDLSGANARDGQNINLWEHNTSCAQKWKLMKMGDGLYVIISACSIDKVVDVQAANTTNGTNIQLWPFILNNKAHMWKIRPY